MKISERMVIVFVLAAVVILAVSAKVFLVKAGCFDEKTVYNSCDVSGGKHDPNMGEHACSLMAKKY